MPRQRHRTALQIPAELIVMRDSHSTPTRVGHEPTAALEPRPAPPVPPSTPKLGRGAPFTEEVYVSPSGRIFLPAGFDLETGAIRTLTRRSVLRQPPKARPRRARVVLGQRQVRARVPTRESWVVPPHLAPR